MKKTPFQEGYEAFPYDTVMPKQQVGPSTCMDRSLACPYPRPPGMPYTQDYQKTKWAKWWLGYKAAAEEDERAFLTEGKP